MSDSSNRQLPDSSQTHEITIKHLIFVYGFDFYRRHIWRVEEFWHFCFCFNRQGFNINHPAPLGNFHESYLCSLCENLLLLSATTLPISLGCCYSLQQLLLCKKGYCFWAWQTKRGWKLIDKLSIGVVILNDWTYAVKSRVVGGLHLQSRLCHREGYSVNQRAVLLAV